METRITLVERVRELGRSWFGAGEAAVDVSTGQLLARTALVFVATLLILRFGDKRFLARRNALDVVLAFVLGTMMSRVITDAMPVAGILAAGVLMMLMHRVLAWAAFRSHRFGSWVKGEPDRVVIDGRVADDVLRRRRVSRHDLEEDVRLNGGVAELDQVRLALLERNGEISVVRRPHVVDVAVKDGVQTIRIELG